MVRQNHADENCGRCESIALKIAPGESVECSDCGTRISRDAEEPYLVHGGEN